MKGEVRLEKVRSVDVLNRLHNRGLLERYDFPREIDLRSRLEFWGFNPRRMVWLPPFFQRRFRQSHDIGKQDWGVIDHTTFGPIVMSCREGHSQTYQRSVRYISVEHCRPDGSGSARQCILVTEEDGLHMREYLQQRDAA